MADFRRRRDAGADNIWIVKPIGGFFFRSRFYSARFGGVNRGFTYVPVPLAMGRMVVLLSRPPESMGE